MICCLSSIQFMVIKKFSSKLVRLKLTIKRKIKLPHRNNIVSPLPMQNSHPIKHLSTPTSKTLLWMNAEVDSQFSHTSKMVYFIKLDNGLILTVYAKLFTRRLTGFLKDPIVILPTLILHQIIYTKYIA